MPTRMLVARARLRRGDRDRDAGLRELPLRRPHRPGQPHGPADQREAARAGARLHREGQGRRRARRRRRRSARAVRQGLVRGADAVRRRRQRHDHRPGGDLRPGARRHPVRRRRRRGAHRQRQPVRPRRLRHVRVGRAGARPSASQLRAGTVSVNGGVSYGADAPFGGYKASGVGRQNGIEGFEQYPEAKTYAVDVPRPSSTPVRVAFVGAGQIGAPMSERLLAAGHEVTVYARRAEVREHFARLGAAVTDSLAEAADRPARRLPRPPPGGGACGAAEAAGGRHRRGQRVRRARARRAGLLAGPADRGLLRGRRPVPPQRLRGTERTAS